MKLPRASSTPPAFSVVIPTYNQADYLKGAIKSVREQTFQDFEIIIVNNHSTDHTMGVIGEVGDPRVRAIDFQNHGVIGASRNVGIRASEGPYVAFLDSDDTWYATKLERVAEAIEEDPQVGLICHDQDLVWDGHVAGRSRYGRAAGFRGSMYEQLLFEGNGPSTSATVVRRQHLDEVGYFSEDEAFAAAEDFDLWLRLSKVCGFQFLREVLGTHHFHGSNSSDNVEFQLRSILNVLDKHCGELRDSTPSYSKRAIRRRYAHAFFGAGRQHQRRGAFKQPLGYYTRTVLTYPFHLRAYAGLALLFADRFLGQSRRRRITEAVLGTSWRWG